MVRTAYTSCASYTYYTFLSLFIFFLCCGVYSGKALSQISNKNETYTFEKIRKLENEAKAGDVISQYNLGLAFFTGNGTTKDYQFAAYWFGLAAAQGLKEAEFSMGVLCEKGLGMKQSLYEAKLWYLKAAEKGHIKAQFNLAELLSNSATTPEDRKLALDWFHKAAEQGSGRAESRIGMAYLEGNGVTKDEVIAVEWLKKAAAKGDREAERYLTLLGSHKTNKTMDLKPE